LALPDKTNCRVIALPYFKLFVYEKDDFYSGHINELHIYPDCQGAGKLSFESEHRQSA
jgi:hypothetical protein